MVYTVKDSVITLKKVSVNSSCGENQFTYYKGDHLIIKNLKDTCETKSEAWLDKPFDKVTYSLNGWPAI